MKGLGKSWNDFDVGVSSTQIEMCRTKGDKFWLYVVEDVKDDNLPNNIDINCLVSYEK